MLGQVVEDRYLVEAELGAGAMGRVYRARHVKVGRPVALKVMHAELARVPSIVERFAREAMVAARLRHPNVVSVLDVGSTPDRLPMIVMELAPGTKLSDVIDGPVAGERVVALTKQLLGGLDHAHRAGLIHRDLKPDNILVEDGDIPRIVDFGIAVTSDRDDSVAGRRLTDANTVIGTPFYMSPEQARAKPLDARTDLFSLGVIVYELLAGVPPFEGTNVDVALANASKDPPAISQRAGMHVDPLLEAFARKLMARRVDDRFQSAREALAMLELIERDRIEAAKALSGANDVIEEPPREEIAIALPINTDVLTTQPLTTTRVPLPAKRRLGPLVGGIAAAVAVVVVASLAMRGSGGRAAAIDVAATAEVESSTRTVVMLAPLDVERVAEAPVNVPRLQPMRTQIASATEMPAPATMPIAATLVTAQSSEESTVAPASVATPAALDVPATSAEVARRYAVVGRALRGAPDALWERYRRIRINEAIATDESRRATMATLDEIETALR